MEENKDFVEDTNALDYETLYKEEKDKNTKLQKKVGELSGAIAGLVVDTIDDKLHIAELESKKALTFVDVAFVGASMWCGIKLAEKFIKKFM